MMERKFRKDVKIGARILGKDEMEKLLPNYVNIVEQVAEIREVAQKYNELKESSGAELKKEKEFNKHFNNIFSLLGERGSGKTSVLFTLKYNAMKEYNKCEGCTLDNRNVYDMFMPVIVPEDMEKSSDVLGWLIGFLDNIVDELEEEIKRDANNLADHKSLSKYFEHCRKRDDDPLKAKYRELQKAYQMRTKEYKQILRDNYSSIRDYVESSSNVLSYDQQLMSKFQQFWDELLNVKRVINKNIEPLLFVFFDDVDMCTDRCFEILNVAMRYLSYPNIVVFITGDYQTFCEALTIDFLRKDNLLGENTQSSCYCCDESTNAGIVVSIAEHRKRLAQDYLLKVLPPALRYYMPRYSNKMKADFTYTTEVDNADDSSKKNDQHESLYKLLIRNFIGEVNEKNSKQNFLIYKDLDKKNGKNDNKLYAFFKIFPDNTRGLMNVYYYLNNHVNRKWNKKAINQLLSIMINSSNVLYKYRDEIYKIINIKEDIEEPTYIDYPYLLTAFENYKHKVKYDNLYNLIEEFVTIFILAHFFENIIRLQLSDRVNVHGAKELLEILNNSNNEFIIHPKFENISLLLKFYDLMSEQNTEKIVRIARTELKNYFTLKYFELIEEFAKELYKDKKDYVYEFFKEMYKTDEKWTDEKLDIIITFGSKEGHPLSEAVEKTLQKLRILQNEKSYKKLVKVIKREETDIRNNDYDKKQDIIKKLNEDLNERRKKELEGYNVGVFEKLHDEAHRLYLLKEELTGVKYEIEKHTNMKLNQEVSLIFDKEKLEKMISSISKNREFIDKQLKRNILKILWERAVNNRHIEYISFTKENKKTGVKKANAAEYTIFNPNEDEEMVGNENIFVPITEQGYLIIHNYNVVSGYLDSLKIYFRYLEKYKLYSSILLPQLNAILEELEEQNEVNSLLEQLDKRKTDLINSIEKGEKNIIRLMKLYKENDKEKSSKSDERFETSETNLKKLMDNLTRKILYKKIQPDKKETINFSDVKTVREIVEIYDNRFIELKQIYSTLKPQVERSTEFFRAAGAIGKSGNAEIKKLTDTIKTLLESDKAIEKSVLDLLLDRIELNMNTLKNQEASEQGYTDIINIKENIELIRSLPVTYANEDKEKMLILEKAVDKIRYILVNYIRLNTLLEIKNRENYELHRKLKSIKANLVMHVEAAAEYDDDKKYSSFSRYIKAKMDDLLKVNYDVQA